MQDFYNMVQLRTQCSVLCNKF